MASATSTSAPQQGCPLRGMPIHEYTAILPPTPSTTQPRTAGSFASCIKLLHPAAMRQACAKPSSAPCPMRKTTSPGRRRAARLPRTEVIGQPVVLPSLRHPLARRYDSKIPQDDRLCYCPSAMAEQHWFRTKPDFSRVFSHMYRHPVALRHCAPSRQPFHRSLRRRYGSHQPPQQLHYSSQLLGQEST
jgi:hypothetical protein